VLVLGTPIALLAVLVWLAVRTVRRRREEALLSLR
jgi:protein-S-isoprenylcysteine O-methyltransferase Ste14